MLIKKIYNEVKGRTCKNESKSDNMFDNMFFQKDFDFSLQAFTFMLILYILILISRRLS